MEQEAIEWALMDKNDRKFQGKMEKKEKGPSKKQINRMFVEEEEKSSEITQKGGKNSWGRRK